MRFSPRSFARLKLAGTLLILANVVAGCETISRLTAVPAEETQQATVLGIPNARYILDDTPPAGLIEEFIRSYERELAYLRSINHKGRLPPADFLAVSGGGDNGAFGAGILVGWSVHGNFAEYVPLALLLMLFAELQRAPGWSLHGIGLLLLTGRVIHAYGVSRSPERLPYRSSGMGLTFTALAAGALLNLWMRF